jgi:hypothetical protein
MVMKAMLIGLLVIGTVAMMETDVSAACYRCYGNKCCCSISSPKEREKLIEEAKKYGKPLFIMGHADDDPMSRKGLRDTLIQDGLPPEMIGELILEGPTPRMSMRKGQEVMMEGTGKSHDHLPPDKKDRK